MFIIRNINEGFDFDDAQNQNDDFFKADIDNLESEIEGFHNLCHEINFYDYFERGELKIDKLKQQVVLREEEDCEGDGVDIIMPDNNFDNIIQDFGKIRAYLNECHHLKHKILVDFDPLDETSINLVLNLNSYSMQDSKSTIIENFDIFEFKDITFPELDVYINIDEGINPKFKDVIIRNLMANEIDIDNAVRVRYENCFLLTAKQAAAREGCFCPEFIDCKTNSNEVLNYTFVNTANYEPYNNFYKEIKSIDELPIFYFHTNGQSTYAAEFYSSAMAESVLNNPYLSKSDKDTLLYEYLLNMDIHNPNMKARLMDVIENTVAAHKKLHPKSTNESLYLGKVIIPYLNESYLPDIKDLKRIKDMISKANGDTSKEISLATKMCNSIKDVDKMGRRYQAAVQIAGIGHPITNVFAQGVQRMNIQDIDISEFSSAQETEVIKEQPTEQETDVVERPKRKYTRRAKQSEDSLSTQEIEALNTLTDKSEETVEAIEDFTDREEILDNLQIFKQYGKLIREFNTESEGSPFYKNKDGKVLAELLSDMSKAANEGLNIANKLFARLNAVNTLISVKGLSFDLATQAITIEAVFYVEQKYSRSESSYYSWFSSSRSDNNNLSKRILLRLNSSVDDIVKAIQKRDMYEADITNKVKITVIKNTAKAIRAYIDLFLDVVDLDDFETAENVLKELYSIKNSHASTLNDYFDDPIFMHPDKVEYDSGTDMVRLLYTGNHVRAKYEHVRTCRTNYSDYAKEYVREAKHQIQEIFKYANSPRNENLVVQIPGVSVRKWIAAGRPINK